MIVAADFFKLNKPILVTGQNMDLFRRYPIQPTESSTFAVLIL